MSELVTAIITTYKRPMDIVERAIDSVLAQDYKNLELIIVDDNREDEEGLSFSHMLAQVVERKIEEGKVNRVMLTKTESSKHGGQAARNTGIHLSNGSLLAFLDDDDEWMDSKISKQVECLSKHPEAGMCYTGGLRINQNYNPPYINEFHGEGVHEKVGYMQLLRGDCIGTTSQAMIRKETFAKVGEFDEALPARQDYEMWIRIARDFPIVGVDEPLFKYYWSKNNSQGQITKNWDKCIEGHTLLYNKYKKDIDNDRAAKFNVIFYLAHYNMQKGDKFKMLAYYAKAFFTSPVLFWEKGLMKLELMKIARNNK